MTIEELQDDIDLSLEDIARLLRVNGRTIRRWKAHPDQIPHSVALLFGYWKKYGVSNIDNLMDEKVNKYKENVNAGYSTFGLKNGK